MCFQALKSYVVKYTVSDFERPLFKKLFEYQMEFYRKADVRNTMAKTISLIAELKTSVDSTNFSIKFSKDFIEDKSF